MLCLCHSGKEYAACCAPYHQGELAPTPLELMRSRYSAYAMKKAKYIMATTASESKERGNWQKRIERFCNETQFVGLEILDIGEDYVMFRAILFQKGKDASFTEKSRFVKESGRWVYLGPITV